MCIMQERLIRLINDMKMKMSEYKNKQHSHYVFYYTFALGFA